MKEDSHLKLDSRKIAITAIYIAIVLLMNLIPFLGYIELPIGRMTFLVIPVVLAAINEGLFTGAVTGAAFGVTSLVKSFTQWNITSPLFNNPLISVLPRICIGLAAFLVFRFFKKYNLYLAFIMSAIAGVLTNTGLVMIFSILFYGSVAASNGQLFAQIALGWISLNFVFELIAAVIVVPSAAAVLYKMRRPAPEKQGAAIIPESKEDNDAADN